MKHDLIKDPACGFYHLKALPTKEDVELYYQKEFYTAQYQQCNDSSLEKQERDKAFNEGRFDDIFHILESRLGSLQGKSLLDIGCGYGEFLLFAKERGLDVTGMEVFEQAVEYLRQREVKIELTNLEGQWSDVAGGPFDVVSLLNVLEHLRDPRGVLQSIRTNLLKPGGVIVVDVPNDFNPMQTVATQVHQLEQWWVAPPVHINYFTPPSLCALLKECGYDVFQMTASFPLELFLLMGHNYVKDPALGAQCHEERVLFEQNMRKYGGTDALRRLYQALASVGLGRQTVAFAQGV